VENKTATLAGLAVFLAYAPLFAGEATYAQLYTDVTSSMGINVPGLGSGAGWSDLDGDGDLDLLVSTSSGQSVFLYRNDGSAFTDVFASSGLSSEARNFAIGDYDNDGLDDLTFISFGYIDTKLYHNLGGLLFDDVSDTAPVFGTYSWRCSWVDYNDDGYLDLYLCGTTSYLFRNNGNSTFTECAAAAGIQAGGRSCAWLDYDNDGLEDCYVGRSGSPNLLYRNLGNGTFQELGMAAGVADPNGTSGVCAGDYDGDGWFDLYSVNISSPRNYLYRNLGNGTFQDVTIACGVSDVGDGRSATFLDIDYDGLIDLFASNHVNPNRLYHNNGTGSFTDIASALGIDEPPDPFGTAFGDYDGDGDVDVFLATHFGNSLLRCDGVTNHWLVIRLTGTVSNRSAIGTVVHCTAGGVSSWQRVDGGHGMGDSDSQALEFGLGGSTGPVEVEISWPSGLVESYNDLVADTHIDITEGSGTGVPDSGAPSPEGISILGVAPNPASGYCVIRFQAWSASGRSVMVALFDTAGRLAWSSDVQASNDISTINLPIAGLASGVYFARVSSGMVSATRRLVVIR
jgi:hypothetical protein